MVFKERIKKTMLRLTREFCFLKNTGNDQTIKKIESSSSSSSRSCGWEGNLGHSSYQTDRVISLASSFHLGIPGYHVEQFTTTLSFSLQWFHQRFENLKEIKWKQKGSGQLVVLEHVIMLTQVIKIPNVFPANSIFTLFINLTVHDYTQKPLV